MKNQYFGDSRDYFKYDVLERLVTDIPLDQLTCLWMLTQPDRTGEGRVRFVPDAELPELTAFFRARLDSDDASHRSVSEMAKYFGSRPFRFTSYRDRREDFGHATRSQYFEEVPAEALQHAVVFFDPDIGMEPRKATRKHLRFAELEAVLARMDASSIAVVYQHQRRVRDFWAVMARQLAGRIGRPVAYIAEPAVAFYGLTSSPSRRREAYEVLQRISSRHTPGATGHRTVGIAD
jgi:hypothetical protein